jgi:hypothetical protein
VLIVNPNTGQIEDFIPVGDNPDHIAVSADGQYLYVGIDQKAVVRRFHLPSHTPDFDITVGALSSLNYDLAPILIAVFPTDATSIVVANGKTLAGYDGSTARPGTAPFGYPYDQSASIYARQNNGAFYAYTNGAISTLAITASGVTIGSTVNALPVLEARARWSGGLVTDDWGYVFDLDTGVLMGRLAMPAGVIRRSAWPTLPARLCWACRPAKRRHFSAVTRSLTSSQLQRCPFQGSQAAPIRHRWPTGARTASR